MSKFSSLFRVELDSRFPPKGGTKHALVIGGRDIDFQPFVALEIARYPDDPGFYLLYFPESGLGTDTCHESLEDAMHQADFEFGVMESDWTPTNRDVAYPGR